MAPRLSRLLLQLSLRSRRGPRVHAPGPSTAARTHTPPRQVHPQASFSTATKNSTRSSAHTPSAAAAAAASLSEASKKHLELLQPHPTIPELADPSARRFTACESASNFVDYFRVSAGLPKPLEESRDEMHPKKIKHKIRSRVALTVHLPTELRSECWTGCDRVVGVGDGASLSEARKAARMDLAERLFCVLNNSDMYLVGKDKPAQSALDRPTVAVDLGGRVRERLRRSFAALNQSQVFHIDASAHDVGPRREWGEQGARTRPFVEAVSAEGVRALPPPAREASRLPIWKLYHQIIHTIEANNVTVLSAATGSGKTTQLPQYILDHYLHARQHYGQPPSVLVTQPRRIAAKSVAQRVAEERERMASGRGAAVGYSVRFDSAPPRKTEDGSILFCTAGILLRRLQSEPDLRSFTHVVLDEVHERDVFTDILLLVTRNILRIRPDLRVILMSATMDAQKFVSYFEQRGFRVGKVLDIEGTNYPVTEAYLEDIVPLLKTHGKYPPQLAADTEAFVQCELAASAEEGTMSDMIIREHKLQEVPLDIIASLISHIVAREGEGAILVFLPGWEEIKALHALLSESPEHLSGYSCEFHLLHSTAPPGSADAAFRRPAPAVRKIIMATNIAESSVTIPDVVFVIDSGKQKVMHYDQLHRMNVLEPCWISKANLRQRLGRAGRCQAGKYFGLFSRHRSRVLPEQTRPELLRLGLDEVCLNLKAMGFAQSSAKLLADAIDAPDLAAIKSALVRLSGLGAIDSEERLTPLGQLLAMIPIHPAMGKMLVTSVILKCLGPILTTVSSLGQRIFRPARFASEKIDLHAFFSRFAPNIFSDHLLLHRLFCTWKSNPAVLRLQHDNATDRLVSQPALFRMDESRVQVVRELRKNFGVGGDVDTHSNNDALVRLVLASGFYPDIALYKDKRNSFRLRKIREAATVVTSVNHSLGVRTAGHPAAHYRLRSRTPKTVERPLFYIYEELIDIGQKLLSRTTAVDPLVFSLFAQRTQFDMVPVANGKAVRHLRIDDWLSIRAQDASAESDLGLLNELRLHWNDFVQFVIYKQLRQETLSAQEEGAVQDFVQTILVFVESTNINRRSNPNNTVQKPHDKEKGAKQHQEEEEHINVDELVDQQHRLRALN